MPFTFYFLLFGIAVLFANSWLGSQALIPDSSFADIFKLLLKTGVFSCCYYYGGLYFGTLWRGSFFFGRKERTALFFIETKSSQQNKAGNPVQQVQISVAPVLKPLLGFIKLRLQYDGKIIQTNLYLRRRNSKDLFLPALRVFTSGTFRR